VIECNLAGARNLLCLGAHSDDIEIGCGGTILKLARQNPDLNVLWVVFSANAGRSREAQNSGREFLNRVSQKKIVLKNFKGSFFPFQGAEIKKYFETLKSFEPDVVFTHHRDDRHQDHRVLSDLTWNTFRNHLILEYEIPKYDGDLGIPNFFVALDEKICREKVGHLRQFFQTQGNKHWFTDDTFLSLMRLRGIECAAQTKYAEAFYCRKLVLGGL
jgi:LmbE family N-acetylglucosaminyl deacetylase